MICVHNVFITILITKGKPPEQASIENNQPNQQDLQGSPIIRPTSDFNRNESPEEGGRASLPPEKRDSFMLAQEIQNKFERKLTNSMKIIKKGLNFLFLFLLNNFYKIMQI